MIRTIIIHAAVLGQSFSAARPRLFHVPSSHALSFVGARQKAAFTAQAPTRHGRLEPFAREMKYTSRYSYRGLDSKLTESSTDHLDRKTDDPTDDYLYNDGDDLIYDYDADAEGIEEDEEAVDEAEDIENTPTRSYLLHKALLDSVQLALKNLNKKTTSLQRELEKAQSLEETMSRANLIVSNLYRLTPGVASIEVEDWENDGRIVELVLNTKEYSSAQEESDALFALARKMKRGSKIVEELLNSSLEAEEILKDALAKLAAIDEETQFDEGALVLIQESLERTSQTTGFKPLNLESLLNPSSSDHPKRQKSQKNEKSQQNTTRYKPNPRELLSPSGLKVLVGRNRRDNEAICFQLSRPTDIWMHSRGCPGAHVLLCVRRGSPEATDEDLQFAADLAVFYSDNRTERKAPVTTAEPKHITKPRGVPPGAVSLRQEGKTLMGRPEMVSDDLKEAREMSGGAWDEQGYRKDGTRSRNKKRTAAVEKASRDKKRQEANAKNKRKARKAESDWY